MPENQRARGQLYFRSHRRAGNKLEGPLGFYLLPFFFSKLFAAKAFHGPRVMIQKLTDEPFPVSRLCFRP